MLYVGYVSYMVQLPRTVTRGRQHAAVHSVICKQSNLQYCHFLQIIVYEMVVSHVFEDNMTGGQHCFLHLSSIV